MSIDVYKEWLGIPEEFRPPTHYQLLRLVDFDDEADRIYKFYKKLNTHVRKYATGKYSIESQTLLNELAKAMLCLTDLERKREYDISLGREMPEEEIDDPKDTLDYLLKLKVIERNQKQEIKDFAERRGLSIRDAVVQMKLADMETATRAYAIEMRRPYLDLAEMVPEDAVLDQLPRSTVKKHGVIPLFIDDDVVLVACAQEPEHELEDEVRLRYGLPMRAVLSTPRAINQAISTYYPPGVRETVTTKKVASSAVPTKKTSKVSAEAKSTGNAAMDGLQSDQTKQQRMINIIVMCWSTVIGYLIDYFVIKALVLPLWSSVMFLTILFPLSIFALNYKSILGKK